MMPPAALAPAALTAAYEQVRAWATGGTAPGPRPPGLAVFLRRGMSGWLVFLLIYRGSPALVVNANRTLAGSALPVRSPGSRSIVVRRCCLPGAPLASDPAALGRSAASAAAARHPNCRPRRHAVAVPGQ